MLIAALSSFLGGFFIALYLAKIGVIKVEEDE